MNFYQTKTYDLQIKDVDKAKGIVSGYFSKFGNKDSDGDVIQRGAFTKTIQEWGPKGRGRIQHLKNHDRNRMIGKITELSEDDFGLAFVSQLSKSTMGRDALIEYQEGLIKEHSIGFRTVKEEDNEDFNLILEVQLWEGSGVTWGSNMDTPVTDVKSFWKPEEIPERIENLIKYIKIGEFSDEKLYNVELELKQLQSFHKTQPVPSTDNEDYEAIINRVLKL